MSLHFVLKVNGSPIGALSVQRLESADVAVPPAGTVCTYQAELHDLRDPDGHRTGPVEHRYGDGPWQLIRAALDAVLDPPNSPGIPADPPEPVIGDDGYPRRGHDETLAGCRVWRIDTDGESSTMLEGHGTGPFEVARSLGDETATVREGWARFVDRCDCDPDPVEGCNQACDCGGHLPPCGDDWGWQVTECPIGAPGAMAVSWVVSS